MVKQFDVYRNPSAKSNAVWPYYLILQHDFYDNLATRVIVPLVLSSEMDLTQTRITPLVSIEGAEYYIFTPTLTFLDVRRIKRADFVCNISEFRNEILAAMDAIITNI